jgi:hypothetical protein
MIDVILSNGKITYNIYSIICPRYRRYLYSLSIYSLKYNTLYEYFCTPYQNSNFKLKMTDSIYTIYSPYQTLVQNQVLYFLKFFK